MRQLPLPLDGSKDREGRRNLPSKEKILRYWLPRDRFVIDLCEPTCWACREAWNGRYDVKARNPGWKHFVAAWTKAPLQRCHIAPDSLDGPNDPSNFVLMCAECHDLAPNTTAPPEYFFEWMQAQSFGIRRLLAIDTAARSFGIDIKDKDSAAMLCQILHDDGFRKWTAKRLGLHFGQLPGQGGPRISPSSLFVGVLTYCKDVLGWTIPTTGPRFPRLFGDGASS